MINRITNTVTVGKTPRRAKIPIIITNPVVTIAIIAITITTTIHITIILPTEAATPTIIPYPIATGISMRSAIAITITFAAYDRVAAILY
jgi:hypothetical protein